MKRSLTAPLVGLGIGATALGGATYVGSSTRCDEGRVVDTLAQCQSIVGAAGANVCSTAFGAFSPAAEQLSLSGAAPAIPAARAVYLMTNRNGAPEALPVTRAAGDPKWRRTNGAIMDPFRSNCSSSRSSSSSSSGSSGRSWGSSSSSSSSSATYAVARGGFGSSGSFFSSGG